MSRLSFTRLFFFRGSVFRSRAVLCLLAGAFLTSTPAWADKRPSEAEVEMSNGEKLLLQAEELRRAGEHAAADEQFLAAIGHFARAHELAPEATGPMLGLGLSLGALGRCEEAIPHLETYLEKKSEGANPAAKENLEKCRVMTGQGSYLSFQSTPSGAFVAVYRDSQLEAVDQTPTLSRFYEPGSYRVTFSLGDKPPVTQELSLVGGESKVLAVDLDRPNHEVVRKRTERLLWLGGGVLLGAAVGVLASALILQ